MEQKSKQKIVQSKVWSEEEEVKLKRSLNCEVKTEDLQRDVTSILNQMSPEEIQEAQKELLSTLDPSLIQFLQKRSAYKDSLNGNVKEEKKNESVTKIDQVELKARQTTQLTQSTQTTQSTKSTQIRLLSLPAVQVTQVNMNLNSKIWQNQIPTLFLQDLFRAECLKSYIVTPTYTAFQVIWKECLSVCWKP